MFIQNTKRKPLIGLFGLTFKQDIDDIRESPAILIAEQLKKEGYDIVVCEPHLKKYKNFKFYSIQDALEISDILVFLVPHSSFKKLNIRDKIIIDLCGIN